MSTDLKTFIDANILIYIVQYKKYAVDEWLEQLYETIYIHKEVMDELRLDEVKKFYQNKLEHSKTWQLFDPDDESMLSEAEFDIYQIFFEQIRIWFNDFQRSRVYKSTTDKGDIAILAGCQFLQIPIITSQDSDFKLVIDDYELKISYGVEEIADEAIRVHDILNLGNLLIERQICSKSQYRQFARVSIGVDAFKKIDKHLIDNKEDC